MGNLNFPRSLSLIIISIYLVSCGSLLVGELNQVQSSSRLVPNPEIAPVFRAYYEHHGGEDVLGKAITQLQMLNGREYQYTEKGCMLFDPNGLGELRFELAPLGMFIGSGHLINGFQSARDNANRNFAIFDEFLPFYNQLGGEDFVGKALTGVRLNSYYKRYEQYYDNLGFYRSLSSPPEEVKLLSYGIWICQDACTTSPPASSKVDIKYDGVPTFSDFFTSYSLKLTGYPLTDAYETPDGSIEQVFESVILSMRSNTQSEIELKDLHGVLNLPRHPQSKASELPEMIFFEIEAGKGYDIPAFFYEFIQDHGGFDLSGKPISRLRQQGDNIRHQCFEKYCLIYDLNLPEGDRVQPEMLGYSYREIYYGAWLDKGNH